MQIISLDTTKNINLKDDYAVALGYFDGVHLGHQQLIGQAKQYALKHDLKTAVMTFDVDPWLVLKRIDKESLLTPLPQRFKLLEQLGVDTVFVLHFTLDVAHLDPKQFIELVMKQMNPKYLVCGQDFRFGFKGAGDAMYLQHAMHDVVVEVQPLLLEHDQKIGTTRIIEALKQGHLKEACHMLSRPYEITGKVIEGNQRGRTIGFPTANIDFGLHVLPKRGVYYVHVDYLGQVYNGMCNIGFNPTFNKKDGFSLEVHLFGFDQTIYGEYLTVRFIDFIRDEKTFKSIEDLVEQLNKDCQWCLEREQLYDSNQSISDKTC